MHAGVIIRLRPQQRLCHTDARELCGICEQHVVFHARDDVGGQTGNRVVALLGQLREQCVRIGHLDAVARKQTLADNFGCKRAENALAAAAGNGLFDALDGGHGLRKCGAEADDNNCVFHKK